MNNINITFQNKVTIYEHTIISEVKENEFNFSSNPTVIENKENGELKNLPDFSPYVTTIGFYNDQGDLLMVGKFSQPIPIS